jgi:hypothetical protein
MTQRPLLGAASVIPVVVVLAAGCGSSSSSPYATKAEFAAAMNKLCVSGNAKAHVIGTPSSLSDLVSKEPQLVANVQNIIGEIKNLGSPPGAIRSQVDDFLSKAAQDVSLLQQVTDAAKANNVAKMTTLGTQAAALAKLQDADANAIGAPACLSTAT